MNLKRGAMSEKRNREERDFYQYLYETYYASLCHYASRILNGAADEEDVVQDIFIKLWERKTDTGDIRTMGSYLYRVVRNTCLTFLRDNKGGCGEDISLLMPFLEDDSKDREQMLLEEEYYRLVYRMIESMSSERRRVILLTLEGKKNEEIAETLCVSVNTVKTLKKRAYLYLRENLPREAWYILIMIGAEF